MTALLSTRYCEAVVNQLMAFNAMAFNASRDTEDSALRVVSQGEEHEFQR